jgi:hypothetical protein
VLFKEPDPAHLRSAAEASPSNYPQEREKNGLNRSNSVTAFPPSLSRYRDVARWMTGVRPW